MLSFLFWNLAKRSILDPIARLVDAHNIHVLMLAECRLSPTDVLAELNLRGSGGFVFPNSRGEKLRVFTRAPVRVLTDEFNDETGGLTIRHLQTDHAPGIILGVLHFPSRVNWGPDDQALQSTTLAGDVLAVEEKLNHSRTVLVGDFNMNPFDLGMVGAQALHAVMTRALARREERIIQGRPYKLFYNPMWGVFGDRSHGPPGSFYLSSSRPGNTFWHTFDQVLLRPELMDTLSRLEILQGDGTASFLSRNGLPSVSDHLPIQFTLDV